MKTYLLMICCSKEKKSSVNLLLDLQELTKNSLFFGALGSLEKTTTFLLFFKLFGSFGPVENSFCFFVLKYIQKNCRRCFYVL